MANMTTSIVMELVDRVTRPVRRIQQALSGLGRRAGLDRLAGAARRVGTAMSDAVGQARALGERMLMMGGLAAGAVWGVERLVSGVTDVGTAVKESAERLSVGTTWLQEWQYVGKQFGVQNDALVDGLKELSLRADEFVMTAGGPAAEAFGRLGINIDDLRKTGGDTAAMFDLVRSRLGNLENDAARQRVLDEIFGGQGAEQMVEMLGATREEIERMMQAGRDRGAILTEEEIENSREYTRQMGDLRTVLFGIQASVVGELLPAINEWIGRMGALGQANREAVASDIVDGIRDVWRGMRMVGAAVSWAAGEVGGFGNLIALVAALIAGRFLISLAVAGASIVRLSVHAGLFVARNGAAFVRWLVTATGSLIAFAARGVALAVTSLVSLSRGLMGLVARAVPAAIAGIRALSLALLTTPIGWIITGVAAVAGAVYLIYRNWGAIGPWFQGLWDGIKAFFSQGIGEITRDLLSFSPAGLLLRGIDAVFELFGARPLSEIGGEWIGGLVDGVASAWDALPGWIEGRFDALRELFLGFSLGGIGGDWIDGLKSGLAGRWEGLTGWLSSKIDGLTSWLPDWAKDGLGIEGVSAPQGGGSPEASLGPPVANDRQGRMPGPQRTDVGGELRIVLDSEGRPRVAESRRNGGLDFNVESGLLGVMP